MLSEKNILKLEIRRRIYNFIDKNPGLNLREISRRMNIPLTTLRYHLKFLKNQELINLRSDGIYKRFYATGKMSALDKQILGLLRRETSCRIFLHLLFSVSCSQIELSRELDISPAAVSYHIDRMLDMNIIEEAPVCNGIIYPFPNPENPRVIERKPVGTEKFYRRKNQEVINAAGRVLIAHKDSLSNKEYIDTYLDCLENLKKLGLCGKKLKEEARKKFNIKKGKKVIQIKIPSEDELYKLFLEFFKPPFAA